MYIPADVKSCESSQLTQVTRQPLEPVAMEIEALKRGGPEFSREFARLCVCGVGGLLLLGGWLLGTTSDGIKHSIEGRERGGRE